jgi:enediyne biosynthesis protein E4
MKNRRRTFQRNHASSLLVLPLATFHGGPPKRRFGGPIACLILLANFAVFPPSSLSFEWQTGPGYRYAPLSLPAKGRTGFTLLEPSATGIRFTNTLAQERWLTNTMWLNGSGVAAGDVDGDGWIDLFFCSLEGHSTLYRNLGNWKFQDITASAGVGLPGVAATGAALVDVDGDGNLDLVVNSFASGTFIFLNDGKGHFTRLNFDPPLNFNKAGMSLALADIDGDGALDLYVANYRTWSIRDRPDMQLSLEVIDGVTTVVRAAGRPVSAPDLVGRFTIDPITGLVEHGEADALFLNDGHGRMTPLSWTDGRFLDEEGKPLKAPPYDWGLSVMFRDLNGDGAPDLYVCNDFESPDRIWINTGDGHFRALPRLALRSTSLFSMGIDFADVNRDGFDDFFVVDMLSPHHKSYQARIGDIKPLLLGIGQIDNRPQYSHNTLLLNRGDGTYADIACFSGVSATDWSWTPVFLDVDLDGYEDLLIATGHEIDAMNVDVADEAEVMKARQKLSPLERLYLRKRFARHPLPKVAFRNRGDLTFENVSDQWGFNTVGVSQGMALADLDNDGDLDVVCSSLNGPVAVFRNDTIAPRLAVRLKGKGPNTRGIGAKIKVLGGPVPQTQQVIAGGRYLSSDDPMRVFAAGSPTNILTIEVTWRSGARSVVHDVKPNCVYEIDEDKSEPAAGQTQKKTEPGLPQVPSPQTKAESAPSEPAAWGSQTNTPLFEDVSRLLNHTHHEDPFDDFLRQPLLPHRLSQLGPGVAWHDLDADGWADLIVSTGRGGRIGVFHNDGRGGFSPVADPPFNKQAGRDQTTVLGIGPTLFVGLANYEDGSTNGGCIAIMDFKRKVSGESVLGPVSSTGPMAFGDIDGKGRLDLFIGGRCVAGRYPEPPTSLLLRNENGRFVVAQKWSGPESLGLVSGAVFADLNGDGIPELVLACEWGPIRILTKTENGYREITRETGLAEFTGWWQGVTVGDFDGDGRLDIAASNWGLNNRFPASREHPRRLYYGDLIGSGTLDLIEAYHDPEMNQIVPDRGWRAVRAALPFLQKTIPNFTTYAQAGLEQIYGESLKKTKFVEATTLATMVFLNRGDHFEPVVLPVEAQFAPAFGLSVGDFDGDGNEDLFLSQNFFAVNADAWRNDAGRGLLLKGDGRGGFQAVPGQQSGLVIYGEQRGCALSDYDGDGRVDLVVTQNGAPTKLFHNVAAKPGLRIRLKGPPLNPSAVGASLRLRSGTHQGPLREIHAGSGYWSTDDPVQVMTLPEEPTSLWVRWPGGRVTTSDIPPHAKEIAVEMDGSVERVR